MSKWKNIALIVVALGIFSVVVMSVLLPTQETMNEDEVKEWILEQYGGTILSIQESEQFGQLQYHLHLLSEDRYYEIKVDPFNQLILSLEPSSGLGEGNEPIVGGAPEQILLSQQELRNIVQQEFGDKVTIFEVELMEQEGNPVYRLSFQQGEGTGEILLDAQTGEVLFYSLQENSMVHEKEQVLIGEAEAERIALLHVEGVVDDVDLDEENGRLVYEVEVEIEAEDLEADVIIDAITGEVIAIRWED
ncbi:hypothetical protein JCM9140_1514 [Halalkalibacter wakoensis JCM 9140]|uniref:PepSY domain-containing protein n=1 Tax=Halalkalibacter wakoensis JCM 9140 TaxID=1236970 RepID=W4Q0Q0_9BACI|nr:PepSY domain-containing protein [Halalkalibacter wakoensis]GAE25515.1 hypothetical protein JCM9140_1514 [Halalkalibacter wakoensis JCM 9140]